MNYSAYLLEELNKTKAELGYDNINIVVSKERSFRLPANTLLFIIKELTGSYTLNIKTQPFQIIVYSELDTFDTAKQILDYFILNHKNGSTESVFYEGTTLIKQDYDTSVILRNFVQAEAGFRASLYCFGVYVKCANLSDVQNVIYRYEANKTESVNYVSASVVYAAVVNTTKVSGEEISTSMKQEAGLTLSMVLMNDNSNFVKKINQIMLGEESGNSRFSLSFELNGITYNESFLLSDASFSTDRTNAPGLNVTFTR